MTVSRSAFLIVLLAVGSATADTFTFPVTEQNVLDNLPALCSILRAQLPPAQQSPWNVNACAKQMMIYGAKTLHMEEEGRLSRFAARQRVEAARRALEPTATPTP